MAWILDDSMEIMLMVLHLCSRIPLLVRNVHELFKMECLMSVTNFQMDQKIYKEKLKKRSKMLTIASSKW